MKIETIRCKDFLMGVNLIFKVNDKYFFKYVNAKLYLRKLKSGK
jgi:hypothetical protein